MAEVRFRRHNLIALVLFSLATTAPSLVQATGAQAFNPTGTWTGPCVSQQRTEGTLTVTFRKDGPVWKATGTFSTPGYPISENVFEEVKVEAARVSFVALWGRILADFAGAPKDGKLVGELTLTQEEQVVMRCTWSLARVPGD